MSSAMLIDAVLLCGVHLGLTLYEAGTVSHRNIQSVFLRSLICSACVIIMWYLIGYGFAFGSGNSFVGNSDFAVTAKNEFWWQIVVEGLKCQIAVTIFNGSVTERFQIAAYACVVLLISVLVYPLPSHWMKSSGGFLQDGRATEGIGCIDSGGASQVHLIAGVMGVIGAIMIGPRMGRFTPDGTCSPKFLSINNPSLVYSGLSLAILSWLGFLSGAYSNSSTSSGRAFESSLIALSSGTLVGIFLSVYYLRCHSVGTVLKCAFAGLVSISASAPIIEPYFAIVVGVIGAGLCFAGSRLLLRLHIDDALDVSSVHGLSGMWGTLVPGLFSSEHYVRDLRSVNEFSGGGVLLGNGGSLLAAQTLALLLPLLWVSILGYVLLACLKHFENLRIEIDLEMVGMDIAFHDNIKSIARNPYEQFIETDIEDRSNQMIDSQYPSNAGNQSSQAGLSPERFLTTVYEDDMWDKRVSEEHRMVYMPPYSDMSLGMRQQEEVERMRFSLRAEQNFNPAEHNLAGMVGGAVQYEQLPEGDTSQPQRMVNFSLTNHLLHHREPYLPPSLPHLSPDVHYEAGQHGRSKSSPPSPPLNGGALEAGRGWGVKEEQESGSREGDQAQEAGGSSWDSVGVARGQGGRGGEGGGESPCYAEVISSAFTPDVELQEAVDIEGRLNYGSHEAQEGVEMSAVTPTTKIVSSDINNPLAGTPRLSSQSATPLGWA